MFMPVSLFPHVQSSTESCAALAGRPTGSGVDKADLGLKEQSSAEDIDSTCIVSLVWDVFFGWFFPLLIFLTEVFLRVFFSRGHAGHML